MGLHMTELNLLGSAKTRPLLSSQISVCNLDRKTIHDESYKNSEPSMSVGS